MELFEVDARRVFGLISSVETLTDIRSKRIDQLGSYVPGYAERERVEVELEEARALMRRIGCLIVRTDNRAIEETAQDIIRYLKGRLQTAGLIGRVSMRVLARMGAVSCSTVLSPALKETALSDIKRVYAFGGDGTEGGQKMKFQLGGKGANLAEMARLGPPGPSGLHHHLPGVHGVLQLHAAGLPRGPLRGDRRACRHPRGQDGQAPRR